MPEGVNFRTERFSPDATQHKRREESYKKPPRRPKQPVEANDHRPRITLRANDIERIVDEAEGALIRAGRGLYQRDGKLVSVERVPAVAAHGQRLRVQRIYERGERALQEDLSSAATFEKWDARSDRFVATDPPMTIVKTLQERRGRLRLPVLAGVVNAPTMRPDGSLLTEPGYDANTGLLFDPLGVSFPAILDRPTRGDAEKALTVLSDLIRDFPFVKPQHRAVALSAILTAPIRRSLPAAPLHAYTAPVAGSGKTKLLDIAGVIATGSEAPVTAPGKDEEELEKRLVSSLLAADQIIAIDNCSRPIGSDLLCQMLTQPLARPRVLGKSEAPTCSTGAFVAATGNNLVLVGDLTRRAIVCRLDPKVERPELRVFEKDPVEAAKRDRAKYLVAVLTVLRSYHVAGKPQKPVPLGSFEAWSDLVRGALLWLDCPDPVETMEEVRNSDPALAQLRIFMTAWRAIFPGEQVTGPMLIRKAMEQQRTPDGTVEFVNEALREALLNVAGRGGAISSRALGIWLSSNKGRIVDGMRIEQNGERSHVAVWTLIRS